MKKCWTFHQIWIEWVFRSNNFWIVIVTFGKKKKKNSNKINSNLLFFFFFFSFFVPIFISLCACFSQILNFFLLIILFLLWRMEKHILTMVDHGLKLFICLLVLTSTRVMSTPSSQVDITYLESAVAKGAGLF